MCPQLCEPSKGVQDQGTLSRTCTCLPRRALQPLGAIHSARRRASGARPGASSSSTTSLLPHWGNSTDHFYSGKSTYGVLWRKPSVGKGKSDSGMGRPHGDAFRVSGFPTEVGCTQEGPDLCCATRPSGNPRNKNGQASGYREAELRRSGSQEPAGPATGVKRGFCLLLSVLFQLARSLQRSPRSSSGGQVSLFLTLLTCGCDPAVQNTQVLGQEHPQRLAEGAG